MARDAECALRAVEEEDGIIDEKAIAEAAKLLREIVGQEFEVSDDKSRASAAPARSSRPRPRDAPRAQDRGEALQGYKLHAAAAADEPILTSICVSPGNEHDGQHAGTLIDQQPEERRPQRVIGDTAYGNIETREQLEARGRGALPGRYDLAEGRGDRQG